MHHESMVEFRYSMAWSEQSMGGLPVTLYLDLGQLNGNLVPFVPVMFTLHSLLSWDCSLVTVLLDISLPRVIRPLLMCGSNFTLDTIVLFATSLTCAMWRATLSLTCALWLERLMANHESRPRPLGLLSLALGDCQPNLIASQSWKSCTQLSTAVPPATAKVRSCILSWIDLNTM